MALGAVALAPVPACSEPGAGCLDVAAGFALTRPAGAGELVPGTSLELAWAPATVDGATVAVTLVDGATRVDVGEVGAEAGRIEITETAPGTPVPTGVYRIEASFGGCAATATVYDGGPSRLVYAQGVGFAQPALDFSGAGPHGIVVRTVSLSTFEIELFAGALRIAAGSVPGELVEMTRMYAFTGMTTEGAAVPAGTYALRAHVTGRGGTVMYDVDGPMMTWTP